MPTNIEIKARVADLGSLRQRVEAIADSGPETMLQEDTFFQAQQGRLKLRTTSGRESELIQYRRQDRRGPTASDYSKVAVAEPNGLREALGRALGIRAVVRKRRAVYRVGGTRIHLDEVEGLGSFMELEVELADGESIERGAEVAQDLAGRLGIDSVDLIEEAYIDLLEQGCGWPPRRQS